VHADFNGDGEDSRREFLGQLSSFLCLMKTEMDLKEYELT
jgi:hypothetical protein